MVIDYMMKRGVPQILLGDIKVILLVPKDRDVTTLSFVSFKINASIDVANIITKIGFWPVGCILKEFVHKHRQVTELSLNKSSNSVVNFPQPAVHQNNLQRQTPTQIATLAI